MVVLKVSDEQHPSFVDSAGLLVWRAHCNACGSYVEDYLDYLDGQPAADYLCDRCEEDDR